LIKISTLLPVCLQTEKKRLLQERTQWQSEFQQAKARLEGVNKRLQHLSAK
jgi:hypothetical protein